MRFAYFTHSLASCWNHGNAHFLRGVLRELRERGHAVRAYEPEGAWSLANLLRDHGPEGLEAYRAAYPELSSSTYDRTTDLEREVGDADVVLVHEWNEPWLVAALGRAKRNGARFTLLFHDTHHRAVSDPDAMRAYDLDGYDGVLAFGEALAEVYRRWGWGGRVFVWHEAADTRLFRPADDLPSPLRGGVGGGSRDNRTTSQDRASTPTYATGAPPSSSAHQAGPPPSPTLPHKGGESRQGLVWIGNWGDDERGAELETFLFRPAQAVGLSLDVYGVRYPETARATLARYGAAYHGWLPNARAPAVFARHLATVHVPRRFYAEALPGIPTIRVFEALACGIPLVCAPWNDSEGLFRRGRDYLVAGTGEEMVRHLGRLRDDPELRAELIRNGLESIGARHTCAHRVDELLAVVGRLRAPAPMELSA